MPFNSKRVLGKLCSLFGVTGVLDGQQWLGLVSEEDGWLAEESANKLCLELRDDIIPLTDAFDLPDRILASTIGRSDGNIYEALLEEARRSSENVNADGTSKAVPPWFSNLEKFVDKDFLALRNRQLPSNPNPSKM